MFEAVLAMKAGSTTSRQADVGEVMCDLLTRVAEHQDRSAFTQLFEHFGPRLKGFMMKRGLESEQAEDMAQETMIKVWHKARLFNAERGSVSTWVFTIARNLHVDAMRRQSIVKFTDLADFDEECEDPVSDEQVIQREEAGLVAEAVAKLPAEQKEIIELAFMRDLSQTEISERLGVPLGTVKSRMRLAYQKLSKSLEDL
ncbi:MAG: sigma-70 family RNA polymerase sigma factor [Pseudomonadota bacterium]